MQSLEAVAELKQYEQHYRNRQSYIKLLEKYADDCEERKTLKILLKDCDKYINQIFIKFQKMQHSDKKNGALYVSLLKYKYIDWLGEAGREPTWEEVKGEFHYSDYIYTIHRKAINLYKNIS